MARPRTLALASRRAALVALVAALAACASAPAQLCGTWASGDLRERWWVDGRSLHGEGSQIDAGVARVTEALRIDPRGRASVYVAAPRDQPATEFRAIRAHEARYGPGDAAGFEHWVWANYAHDFPQEIHYLVSPDQLRAVVSGPDRETGWTFTRAAPCPTRPR